MHDIASMSAAEVIAALGLQPHPEGGHYRETFRDPHSANGRSVSRSANSAGLAIVADEQMTCGSEP